VTPHSSPLPTSTPPALMYIKPPLVLPEIEGTCLRGQPKGHSPAGASPAGEPPAATAQLRCAAHTSHATPSPSPLTTRLYPICCSNYGSPTMMEQAPCRAHSCTAAQQMDSTAAVLPGPGIRHAGPGRHWLLAANRAPSPSPCYSTFRDTYAMHDASTTGQCLHAPCPCTTRIRTAAPCAERDAKTRAEAPTALPLLLHHWQPAAAPDRTQPEPLW
jgi:hypothetical protein